MNPPLLRFDGVSFAYGQPPDTDRLVLTGIDLECRESEVVAFLGPSGCGKSSLLRLVAGLEFPTRGRVLLDGRRVRGPGRDRAFVFQAYTSFPWLSVAENVAFGLDIGGISDREARERAAKYVRLVGLEGHESRYPDELSGGMRQRVAVARAFANNPRVLLMDEPFGALDTHTKTRLQDEFPRLLAEEPKTVLFVTHDIEEALVLADRIVLLGGRPATVRFEMDNPIPRPHAADVRFETAFVEARRLLIERFRSLEEAGLAAPV